MVGTASPPGLCRDRPRQGRVRSALGPVRARRVAGTACRPRQCRDRPRQGRVSSALGPVRDRRVVGTAGHPRPCRDHPRQGRAGPGAARRVALAASPASPPWPIGAWASRSPQTVRGLGQVRSPGPAWARHAAGPAGLLRPSGDHAWPLSRAGPPPGPVGAPHGAGPAKSGAHPWQGQTGPGIPSTVASAPVIRASVVVRPLLPPPRGRGSRVRRASAARPRIKPAVLFGNVFLKCVP